MRITMAPVSLRAPVSSTPLPLQRMPPQPSCSAVSSMKRRPLLPAGGDHEVLRLLLLQHPPLHLDVVAGMAPVAQGVEVAHEQAFDRDRHRFVPAPA